MPDLDPRAILTRARSRGADIVLNAGGIKVINSTRLPAGSAEFIARHAKAIVAVLQDEADEIEERAAIVEFDGNTPRAVAEQFARMCIEARRDPQTATMLAEACGRIVDEAFGRAA